MADAISFFYFDTSTIQHMSVFLQISVLQVVFVTLLVNTMTDRENFIARFSYEQLIQSSVHQFIHLFCCSNINFCARGDLKQNETESAGVESTNKGVGVRKTSRVHNKET